MAGDKSPKENIPNRAVPDRAQTLGFDILFGVFEVVPEGIDTNRVVSVVQAGKLISPAAVGFDTGSLDRSKPFVFVQQLDINISQRKTRLVKNVSTYGICGVRGRGERNDGKESYKNGRNGR